HCSRRIPGCNLVVMFDERSGADAWLFCLAAFREFGRYRHTDGECHHLDGRWKRFPSHSRSFLRNTAVACLLETILFEFDGTRTPGTLADRRFAAGTSVADGCLRWRR